MPSARMEMKMNPWQCQIYAVLVLPVCWPVVDAAGASVVT